MSGICCRHLIGIRRQQKSPFARIIATGFYDGPTGGLIECDSCKTVYSFGKLDWDDQQDMRVFSLAPVPAVRFDVLVPSVLASDAKWPVWVLIEKGLSTVSETVSRLQSSADPIEFVVATRDLLGVLNVWRPPGLRLDVDWLHEMGIDRKGSSE
jgi:hypothetical protein